MAKQYFFQPPIGDGSSYTLYELSSSTSEYISSTSANDINLDIKVANTGDTVSSINFLIDNNPNKIANVKVVETDDNLTLELTNIPNGEEE
jgi:predicted secreted protein